MPLKITFLLLISFCFTNINAQPEVKAIFTDRPIKFDGLVNEDVWEETKPISEFIQREPLSGEKVSEQTEFYFRYDKNNLYVGFRCFQDTKTITAKELARDVDLSQDDRVQIILDTYNDGRTGYWFQIGPQGSIGDALVSENGRAFNKSWDGLWEGKAKIHDNGWDAEIIIPFKTLGFKEGESSWGLKLIRHIKIKSESSYWPATTLDADKFSVSDAGKLTGLEGISQGFGLDFVPYFTSGLSKSEGLNSELKIDGGLDAFYQITPSLKAALTVNTDFAQTEVDARQINLTRFSLFFPEKRDFFLDGSNYFDFGINGDRENPHGQRLIPYFSRSIGLDSLGSPVPIKYGAKFTGQAGKWNIGMLHIKDENKWDNPGYSVTRLSRNIGKQSSIGVIGTNGNTISEIDNSLAGLDLRLATSEFQGNKTIVYNIYGLKSFTSGISGDDVSFGTELNYPNDFMEFRLGYMQIGENFSSGLGFVPRTNIRNSYGGLSFGPRPKKWGILQVQSGFDFFIISDLRNGGLLSSETDFNFIEIDFISGGKISLGSHLQFENLEEDFNIWGNYSIAAKDYEFWWHGIELQTAKRRDFWMATMLGSGDFYDGTRTDWTLQAGYKIMVPLYVGLESDRKYVSLSQGDFTTQIWRMNVNVLFSPNLIWFNFAQYDNESEKIGWQSRFQWIIKPGKEIFFVWNAPIIDPLERFRSETYDARFKIKYTIRF
ncbi:MAG: carbohydrate binding family 9 domain-containing protein [Bacteroidales bacterium]|nr:carbohydrate binding family 9 domain-containing protein [Bacteroidales bacterium]MCF8389909.1 carbohydrate binding family 9 domain-containing protein [Bacteroidales bacterium]